jgi:hypothetical protein
MESYSKQNSMILQDYKDKRFNNFLASFIEQPKKINAFTKRLQRHEIQHDHLIISFFRVADIPTRIVEDFVRQQFCHLL